MNVRSLQGSFISNAYVKRHTNEFQCFGPVFNKYFGLHYNNKNEVFQFAEYQTDAIKRENALSEYFCILTSDKMNAKEAL